MTKPALAMLAPSGACRCARVLLVLALGATQAVAAHAAGPSPPTGSSATAEPDPQEVLRRADGILAPDKYSAVVEMVARRPDGTNYEYAYRVLKRGTDRLLLTFDRPAVLLGHAALRRGDDLYRYVPSLKRSVRVSARADFEAGDFRNADVLRVNLVRDYRVEKMERDKDSWVLYLVATSTEAAYDRIKLWVAQATFMPLREELYATSGKLLRTLECKDVKDLGGHVAPTRLEMTNEVARGRTTTITIKSMVLEKDIPDARFAIEAMGR